MCNSIVVTEPGKCCCTAHASVCAGVPCPHHTLMSSSGPTASELSVGCSICHLPHPVGAFLFLCPKAAERAECAVATQSFALD